MVTPPEAQPGEGVTGSELIERSDPLTAKSLDDAKADPLAGTQMRRRLFGRKFPKAVVRPYQTHQMSK
jgi:hypothetical protein